MDKLDMEILQEKREIIEDALSWAVETCLSEDRPRFEVAISAFSELWSAISPGDLAVPDFTEMRETWQSMKKTYPRGASLMQLAMSPELLVILESDKHHG